MTVCYFGIYKSAYTRNRIMIQGLRENGVEVIECHTRETGFGKYVYLIRNYWKIRKQCDIIIVGFPGHTIMPLAWLLAKLSGKKIIFDVFVSLYDSIILDRKSHSKISLAALKYWLLDWSSCFLADLLISETEAYADYFVRTFKVKKNKFRIVLVGSDDSVLYPRQRATANKNFLVHFHGTYLPIQGILYIVKAAKILEKEGVKFNLIGKLDTYAEAISLAKGLNLKNINFIDYIPYEKLADYMAQADACLGFFGLPDKARRCGAFKVVEALAMKRPLITADTPAMRELLSDRKNVLFCRGADEKDLAAKILELKNNPELRDKIAEEGYRTFKQRLTPEALGKELSAILLTFNRANNIMESY